VQDRSASTIRSTSADACGTLYFPSTPLVHLRELRLGDQAMQNEFPPRQAEIQHGSSG
jgi:hypothetical protein